LLPYVAALSVLIAGLSASAGQEAIPDRLTIGYENEGKVDGSTRACAAHIDEIFEDRITKPEKERFTAQVCASRKRHLDAYDGLQQNFAALRTLLVRDKRLRADEAVAGLQALVKNCIDHKFALSASGGHNYRADVIRNEIAAACLRAAGAMVRTEVAALEASGAEYCSIEAQKHGC
jgi:hypothetical protein